MISLVNKSDQHVIMAPSQLVDRGHRRRPALLLGLAHNSIVQLALERMFVLPIVQQLVAAPHALPDLHCTQSVLDGDSWRFADIELHDICCHLEVTCMMDMHTADML